MKDKTIMKIVEGYCQLGWSPVPIPPMSKIPIGDEWQHQRLTEETVGQHFGNGPMNVGILLGEPSGGLTDVDLDWPESIQLASKFLPPTKTFGREHAPRSHYLYTTPISNIETYCIKIEGETEKIIELRGSGQTVFPGSLYEGEDKGKGKYRGELIRWDDEVKVRLIDADELRASVGKLAAAAYLLRIWHKSIRDDTAIALIGILIRGGWEPADVDNFIGSIVYAANDEEAAQRFKAERVKAKIDGGKGRVRGIPALKNVLGADATTTLLRWLGLGEERDGFFKGKTFVPTKLRDHIIESHELFHDGIGFNLYLPKRGYFEAIDDNVLNNIMAEALRERAASRHVQDALSLLEYKVYRKPSEIPQDKHLINLKNGMLDIRTRELLPHDKKYFSRAQVPIDYDPKAQCPEWLKFLASTFVDDPKKIIAAQDFAGYCMSPTSFIHKALFNWGPGGNGKNTFTNTLVKMLGTHNCAAFRWAMFSDKFMITELRNKFLNVSTEIDSDSKLSTEMFKSISSGDMIDGQVKYQQHPVSFKSFTKLIFNVNNLPIISDHTDAFKRRVMVMGFNQKFEGKSEIKSLELRFEPELSGILNWALKGLEQVFKTKELYESPVMKMERERFLKIMNPLLYFLEERIIFRKKSKLYRDHFYQDYVEWCQKNGHRPKGKINMFEEFRGLYPAIVDRQGGDNCFTGIELREKGPF